MNTQLTSLVEQAVVERLRARASFTALDISNALKSERYPVTHREVAEVVRDIYQTGAMDFYDYDRRLIAVTTDGGAKQTRAFLYLHDGTKERDYTARRQTSLPCVPPDAARDLSDSVPAGPVSILPRPAHPLRQPRPRGSHGDRRKLRRDGAFAVPRALVAQLGWKVGMSLGLTVEDKAIRLTPGGDVPVQVWDGQRVRICKRKLRLGALIAAQVTVEIVGDSLTIRPKKDKSDE